MPFLKDIPEEKIKGSVKVFEKEIKLDSDQTIIVLFKEIFGDLIWVPDNCQKIYIEGKISDGKLYLNLSINLPDNKRESCEYDLSTVSKKSRIYKKTEEFLKAISLFIS